MTMSRRIAALTAVSALVLAGCSSNDEDTETQATYRETTTSESTGDATDEPTDAETAPEAVEPVISDEGMPSVVEEDGIVSLDFEGATEPEQLQVSVVEEGDGDVVSPEDLVVVNYAGQVWGSDETFDSSWARGSMTAFGLDMVVQGWRDGLAGQTEGSRVIVSVPAELGYGPNGGNESAGIGPEDTIVFVVDIDQKVSPDEVGDPDATVVTEADELPVNIEGDLGELASVSVKEDAAKPEETTSIVIAESDGPVVGGEGTTVYFQYSAATWDNSQTEQSIDFGGVQNATIGQGSPFDLLEGVPVDSRVLLLVPGDESTPGLAALVDVVGHLPAPAATE